MLLRWFFKGVKEAKMGELLDKMRYRSGFEEALKQCREIMDRFQGSEETLRHIQRVEETLKMLVVETN